MLSNVAKQGTSETAELLNASSWLTNTEVIL
jgi:hypothetical protein